jgi:hypothetical protein
MIKTGPTSTKNLLASERRVLDAMRRMGFGRFECLQIRNGELVLDPWPRSVRDVKFGGPLGVQTSTTAQNFELKQQVSELFEYIRGVQMGEIKVLEIRHSLPFTMTVEECTANQSDH